MPQRPIVLITGASKGIGAETAKLFARNGYNICINYLSDEKGANSVVKACKDFDAQAIAVKANIARANEVSEMFLKCDEELGTISSLINNAGVIGSGSLIENLSHKALSETFETNVYGIVYCIQEAIKRMSTKHGGQGGTVVNMSSLAATLGSAGEYVHYAASKGAVETLTIGAGKELASSGIRVNAVRVGTTDTTIHAENGNPDRVKKIAELTPMGRIANPIDIAEAAFWLASDKSKFVTGTTLTVAGGLSA